MRSQQGTSFQQQAISMIRLCRGCAQKTGAQVYSIESLEAGGEFQGVVQPDG